MTSIKPMYGIKLCNLKEANNKAEYYQDLKEAIDIILSRTGAMATITLGGAHRKDIFISEMKLMPYLQEELQRVGTELKELGVELDD